MEIFKIWSTFNLKGDALEKMEKFSVLTKLATERSVILNRELKSLSVGFATLNLNAAGAISKLSLVSKWFGKINEKSLLAKDRLSIFDRTVDKTNDKTRWLVGSTGQLANNLSHVALAANKASISLDGLKASRIGASMGGIGGGGGGGRGGRHGGFHLSHLGAIGLGEMGGELSALGASAAYAAPLGLAVGTGIMLHQGFTAQSEFQKQVLQMRGSGLSNAQLAEAQSIAYTPTKGISTIGKLQSLNDAFMATKDWREAKIIAPMLAEAQFAGIATFGGMTEDQTNALVKFSEMRAGGDYSKIMPAMNLGYKIMASSANTIDPKQLAMFMRRATTAGYHLTDRQFAGLEPVMQELTPTITGTGYQTGYQMLATGVGTLNNKKRVAELLRWGIYTDAKKDKNGRILQTTVDPEWLNLYETAPIDFTTKLLGKFKAAGITSSQDIVRHLAMALPNTTSREFSLIVKNLPKIERALSLYDKQPGIHSSFLEALNIPSGTTERLVHSWSSLATSFGRLSSPGVVAGMNALASFLDLITKAFNMMAKGEYWSLSKAVAKKTSIDLLGFSPLGSVIGALHSGAPAVSSAVKVGQKTPAQVNLYMDSKKFASAIFPSMTSLISGGGVTGGSSFTNVGLTPISTNYNGAVGP